MANSTHYNSRRHPADRRRMAQSKGSRDGETDRNTEATAYCKPVTIAHPYKTHLLQSFYLKNATRHH